MPSLKEIKGRIGSVQGTLKITSAMKLVASAKLHKAQIAIDGALPFQQRLTAIMRIAMTGDASHPLCTKHESLEKVSLLCIASNSSLCGGYNSNVIRHVITILEEHHLAGRRVSLYVIGRKLEQALTKWAKPHSAWLTVIRDYTDKGDKPQYDDAARLSQLFADDFLEKRTDCVELMYMHFKNMASQIPTRETLLPFAPSRDDSSLSAPHILEPSRDELLRNLIPDALATKLYAVMLDAQAAEHAARTMAMQTATDNANELLDELQIQYNKGRQAAITAELLDIVGGSMQ